MILAALSPTARDRLEISARAVIADRSLNATTLFQILQRQINTQFPGVSREGSDILMFALLKSIEDTLNRVGDDSQLANVDLQDALQKQAQLIQLIANITRMVSDTALAVIRKIGG